MQMRQLIRVKRSLSLVPALVRTSVAFVLGILLLVSSVVVTAKAGTSTITDLGTLGGSSSTATAINNYDQVAGYSTRADGTTHAFLYSGGSMTDLGALGGQLSVAYGINDSGQVVGYVAMVNGSGPTYAFLYSDGIMTLIPTLAESSFSSQATAINNSGQIVGGSVNNTVAFLYTPGTGITNIATPVPGSGNSVANVATAINNSGQVVGYSQSPTLPYPGEAAFLYSDGSLTYLPTPAQAPSLVGAPAGFQAIAYGINNNSQVIGSIAGYFTSTSLANTTQAFLYSDGSMTALGTLGGPDSVAYGINDSGQVVGYSWTTGAIEPPPIGASIDAFLYSNGTMIDLNSLLPANSGWRLTEATAINNSGQIVGEGFVNGQLHAFLLTQVTFASLINLVNQFDTNGNAAGMVAKLEAAESAFARGNIQSGDNQLHAFINQVSAQSGKSLTAAQAAILIQDAKALMM